MTEGFTVKVDDSDVRDAIRRLRALAADTSSINKQVAIWLASRIKEDHFERQVDEYGHPWPPMSALTRLLRRAGKGGLFAENPKLLRDTGRLRKSITFDFDANGFRVGTNVIYAPIQQFGGVVTPKRHKFLIIPVKGTQKRQKAVLRVGGEHFDVKGFAGKEKYRKRSGEEGIRERRFVMLRRAKIPARPFIYANEEELETITGMYLDAIDKAIFRRTSIF
jgi:phage gpG-like protein